MDDINDINANNGPTDNPRWVIICLKHHVINVY